MLPTAHWNGDGSLTESTSGWFETEEGERARRADGVRGLEEGKSDRLLRRLGVRRFFDDNRWIRKSAVQFKAQIAGLTQEAIIIMIFDMSVPRQWPGRAQGVPDGPRRRRRR